MAFWQRKKQSPAVSQADQKISQVKDAVSPAQAGPAAKKEKTQTTTLRRGEVFSHARGVILGPAVTEKAAALQSQKQYVFAIRPVANKIMVRQAIKEIYGVTPEKIRIVNLPAKKVRFGRYAGARKRRKKAIVTIPADQTIDIHKGV